MLGETSDGPSGASNLAFSARSAAVLRRALPLTIVIRVLLVDIVPPGLVTERIRRKGERGWVLRAC